MGTEDEEFYYLQAMEVDFLTKNWERKLYAKALMRADEWGKKIDKENIEYKKKNRFIDRYNAG